MTTTLKELPIESVKPDPNNPRSGKLDVADLVKSIAEIGLIEPIVVRPVGSDYVVVAGHRRLEAMKKLRATDSTWVKIHALVVTDYNDFGALRDAVAENTVRQALSAMDEANAMVQLSGMGMTDAEIAATFARDAKTVAAAKAISEASEKGTKALKEVKPADGVQLTIEQAAAVAQFGGLSSGRQMMIEIQSGSRYWRSTYEKLVRRAAIDAAAKEVVKEHKGQKKVSAFGGGGYEGPAKEVEPLVNLTDAKGKQLTTAGHKSCPGHAFSVEKASAYGSGTKPKVLYWCTDWKANGHKISDVRKVTWNRRGKEEARTLSGGKGPTEKQLAEEKALDAGWYEAMGRRRVFIDEFVAKPKTGDKWTLTALGLALNERVRLEDGWEKLTLKALVPLIVKTYVLDTEDAMMGDWRWSNWQKTVRVDLLNFLVANGYELHEAEQTAIDRAANNKPWFTRQARDEEFEDDDDAANSYDDEVEVDDDEDGEE